MPLPLVFESPCRPVLNPVVFAYNYTRPAAETRAPVLRRFNLFKPVELSDALQPRIDELPGARTVGPDFAAVFTRTSAWPVEHVFGAPRHRTDSAIFIQHTKSAGGAFLCPYAPFLEYSQEGRIQAGINGFLRVAFGYRLDARSAAQGKHGIAFLDGLGGLFDKYVITLAFDDKFIDFESEPLHSGSDAQRRGNDTYLPLAAGETDRHTGTAPEY